MIDERVFGQGERITSQLTIGMLIKVSNKLGMRIRMIVLHALRGTSTEVLVKMIVLHDLR